jgi:FtsP/CotA-like multicopper oxidase with cupredoxin domain
MSHRFSRREFLAAGATIAGGTALGVTACAPDTSVAPISPPTKPTASVAPDGELLDPRIIRSNGGLATSITVSTDPVTVAGRTVYEAVTYENSFPAPTLWVNAGDQVAINFTNKIVASQSGMKPGYGRTHLDAMTNLHYHGTHVPMTGSADNMLVMVDRNDRFNYRFTLPATHPAGLFFYHPHIHGLVTNQMGRGAAGMFYVANSYTNSIDASYRRRFLVLQQVYFQPDLKTLTFDDGNRSDPTLALTVINGELMPLLRMRPNERQVWDMSNSSTSAFYRLRFPDGFSVRVLGYDGLSRAGFPNTVGSTVDIAPGKRVELEVRAPSVTGTSTLSLDAYFQGVDTWPAKPLATIAVGGAAVKGGGAIPLDNSITRVLPDLSGVTPDKRRTIIFDQNDAVPEGMFGRFRMYLEGSPPHSWDPTKPEWTDSVIGQTEEWTIKNFTAQEHPFHVHINPFQVISVQGLYNSATPPTVLTTGFHDTVLVPPGGQAVVRTRFTDFFSDFTTNPATGPVLMHCHILDHEDMGMMTSFYIRPAV